MCIIILLFFGIGSICTFKLFVYIECYKNIDKYEW